MIVVTSYRVFVRACGQFAANQDTRLGAALAYYTVFSITPLLVFAVRVAGLVFDETSARENLLRQLGQTTDSSIAEWVESLMDHANRPEEGAVATAISAAVLVAGALGMFLHVRGSLSTIWHLQPPRGNTILGIFLDYLLALVMVFAVGLLLLASLALSTALPFVIAFVDSHSPGIQFPWRLAEMGGSLLLLMLLFALLYRVMSGQRVEWRYVWYGSLIASLLFTLGKTVLALYLAYFSPASVYGAAGSVMVFLLWVYYSSLILFLGAELIQARRTRQQWMYPATLT